MRERETLRKKPGSLLGGEWKTTTVAEIRSLCFTFQGSASGTE